MWYEAPIGSGALCIATYLGTPYMLRVDLQISVVGCGRMGTMVTRYVPGMTCMTGADGAARRRDVKRGIAG
jgi:hypothetical protein